MVFIKLEYEYYAKGRDGRMIVVAKRLDGKEKTIRLDPKRVRGVYIVYSENISFNIVPRHLVVDYDSSNPFYSQLAVPIKLISKKNNIKELKEEGDYIEYELKDSNYKPCDRKGLGFRLSCGGCWAAQCCLHKKQHGYNYCDPFDED